MQNMDVLRATKDLRNLAVERQHVVGEYEDKLADIDGRMAAERGERSFIANGIDLATVTLAETVIEIEGDWTKWGGMGETPTVIRDAIMCLTEPGGGRLCTLRLGVKNYASWTCQRSDNQYGCGPSHGYVVFSVGLTPEARVRDLTDEERNAAITYLLALGRVAELRAQMEGAVA